ncbi:MAG: HYR domain-containing protein, partial [candidate division Zixibacteria bacterium]|nr:HYR domain-containing protein [candidate division Zixibacteria bacterium]
GNITQGNDPGQCTAVVSFITTASDNCALSTLVATPPSGSTFPKGITPVKVIATDAAGNKDSCTFNVTVNDTTKPTITCPSDIVVDNSPGSCGAIVNFSAPLATDNCPGVTVGSVPASGTYFPVGSTLVTSTATDASGNQQTCTFTVTVNDTQKPTVTCPGPMTISIPSGSTSTIVTYGVTSGDNCPGLVNVLTPPSGSSFSIGTTTVWCVSTDAVGNKDSCTFTVTVEVGNSAPVIDPIPAKSANEESNLNFGVVAHDLDGDAGITLSIIDKPAGASFTDNGSGSGTFDWTPACDQGGQVYNVKFVASDGSAADTESVAITVNDIPESLAASPNSVNINYQMGAPAPAPIPVSLTDPGCSGQFAWQANSDAAWLSSDADTGTTPSNVHVVVNPASLGVGDFTGIVTFGARVVGKAEFVPVNTVTIHLHVGPAPHDSVWVTNGSGKLGDTINVDVNFCNNHEATGISVGLKYWPHMHAIGASFVGSRVETVNFTSVTINTVERTICIAAIPLPAEPRIAEGCGKLVTLSFVYDSAGYCPFPESSMVEAFPVPPGCSTMLTDTIPAQVIPSFVPGMISLICPPRICGIVKDGSGAPVANAMVQLWSSYPSGSLIIELVDDPDGAICFPNLPGAGPFDLRIFAPGYCTKIISGVGPTGTTPLDFILDPLPTIPNEPSFAWYWSDNAMISGVPLQPGDVITAVDPNGIVCGKTVVAQAGKYNIYVMGDDVTTPGTDEGAQSGDWTAMTGTQFDANFDCSSKAVEIGLCDPWTLFSFNVTPANPSPASVLASIAGEYQIVFTSTCAYGPLSWDASRPFNDLTSMDPFHGFWLKTTGAGIGPISLSGVPVPVSTPLDLCEGWNLISYLPDVPDTFSHALGSIDGDYSHVFGFECGKGYVSWDASRPAFLNDLTCMRPLMGYWLKASVNTTLTYPSAGYTCNEGAPILSKPVNLLANVTTTPWVADFWSVANTTESGIHSGDNLTVRNSAGVICGECLVGSDGAFLVHVYGDDPSTAQVEGAVKGEALTFEINNAPASVQSGSVVWNERESVKLTLVAGKSDPVPSTYALLQNYPNPFNPSTVIRFRLPAAADAKLTIYNVLGQTVRVLFNGNLSAGEHSYEWNGLNENGESVQSGIYFYRLETPSWSDSKKMTFLK